MSIDEIDEYLEMAQDYRDTLKKLYEAMASCQVSALNGIMDTMDALESGVVSMIEDFSRAGAYDAQEGRLSVASLEAAYPHAKSKVGRLVALMREAKDISSELSEFQKEISSFYQEDILATTYGAKRRG